MNLVGKFMQTYMVKQKHNSLMTGIRTRI